MASAGPAATSRGPRQLAFLADRLPSMSAAERKITDVLTRSPDDAISMSITELADRAGVSEATISRYCRRLQFKGYQDLRIRIARELAAEEASAGGSAENGIELAASTSADLLNRTARLLDPAKVDRAADAISAARRVVCVGLGASGIAAQAAAHHLLGIGVRAESHADLHVLLGATALLDSSDVVLAFSRTGSAKDVTACVRLAHAQGATVISVTNASRSPVAKLSDIVLQVASEGTIGTLDSVLVQVFVLEILMRGCLERLGPAAELAAARVSEVIMGRLY
ncbi:MurR/RpiR family transcriptional regulator [Jiangella sp. DSM 45060]|uniref:MurR/RpiR family transcriptional regulator n=1 Tax=Jiangella sp. DSM 45060 TaxID=1798224 RepID=UPI00087A8A35|nr:MurR/RpiR family transcriptional regulator [Jiangella sp. DSM 45060]SDS33773.1 DNA-binding transcriptional regulator, MurR/RpiR family, contains HTH and SIS domains [Jiangella sp. DSM 45060]